MGHRQGHHFPESQPKREDVSFVSDHTIITQSFLGLPGLGANVVHCRVTHCKESMQFGVLLGPTQQDVAAAHYTPGFSLFVACRTHRSVGSQGGVLQRTEAIFLSHLCGLKLCDPWLALLAA